jgi:hypothetical protein
VGGGAEGAHVEGCGVSVDGWSEITVWLEDVGFSVASHAASGVYLGTLGRAMTRPK